MSADVCTAEARHLEQTQRRTVCVPVVDVHTHINTLRWAHQLVRAARRYGVTHLVAISNPRVGPRLRERFPEVELAYPLDYTRRDDPQGFVRANRVRLRTARRHGVGVVKLWFAPRFVDRTGLRLSDPRMRPVLDLITEERFPILIHVADPDRWFATRYDPAVYGTKADQYPALEELAARHAPLPVIVAHMGGHPEDLDHLAALLAAHPNLYLDTSATKWIVRELGRQREAARRFFLAHADRILFGTDQVVTKISDPPRYT
ncbi:MAG: amidohydrolase family protein, partial [Armatimonadetes bacterium]|nr:amidohydrolase family protein [Armatimonadota bacterium]